MTVLASVKRTLWFFKWAILSSLMVLAAVAVFTMNIQLLGVTLLLAALEMGLSFDNAVVNALVLKTMDEIWQKRFLLWGILIAVVGMRLLIPVIIVAVFGHLAPWSAFGMAFTDGVRYGEILHEAHYEIAGFGGMFLAMVFIAFIVKEQEHTWLGPLERRLQRLGELKSFETVLGLALVVIVPMLTPSDHRFSTQLAMLFGLGVFLVVDMVSHHVKKKNDKAIIEGIKRSGAGSFLYLEVLDASFSFDGVIGAFALTTSVVIIMAGLGIGALFVRSMTVFLVRGGHLDQLPHLGHAAHYAIGALAAVMFVGMKLPVPEVLTGLMSVAFIAAGWATSRAHNRRQEVTTLQARMATESASR